MTLDSLDALVQPHRVHRSVYTDNEVFAAEMQRVFGGAWVYLAHTSQIPNPDDFITTRMGLRPLIVTRDSDGTLHALFNRCAHRASTVCQAECGSARRFQCSYHGWTYSNTGELVNLPFAEGYPSSFDRADHGLAAVPRLGTFRGLIFGTLNLDAPSLSEWLGPAAALIDGFVDRSPSGRIQVRNCQRMVYRGNWKLAWDNAGDGLHPTFAHRSFVLLNERQHGGARSLSQFKASPDDTGMYGADLGNGHMFVDQRPGLAQSFFQTQRPVPGLEFYADQVAREHGDGAADVLEMAPGSMINLSIFPNLLIKGNHLETVDPVSVGETRLHTWVGRRGRGSRGGERAAHAHRGGLPEPRQPRRPRDLRALPGGPVHRGGRMGGHEQGARPQRRAGQRRRSAPGAGHPRGADARLSAGLAGADVGRCRTDDRSTGRGHLRGGGMTPPVCRAAIFEEVR